MRARRLLISTLLVLLLAPGLGAQKLTAPSSKAGLLVRRSLGEGGKAGATGAINSIEPMELKEWLSYIASDELQGRQIYTEGLGLAAAYISDHLKEWGVKPAGEDGTYFQTVKVLGVRTNSNSSVTVDVNGQKRTFKDGEGITFPRSMGGKQTVTGDDIQFVGYGLEIPDAGINDYAKVDPKGKVVVYLGAGPKNTPPNSFRVIAARSRKATEKGAIAVIGQGGTGGGRGQGGQAARGAAPAQPATGRGGFGQQDNGDFTTVQRYDRPIPPVVSAQDEAFFELLFSGSDLKYAQIKDLIAKQEPLPEFALKGVKLTFNVDADYTVVRTQLTRNVVGIIPGTDPKLKDTYLAFGAHYDHIGYVQTSGGRGGGFPGGAGGAGGCVGQQRDTPRPGDNVNNGADDDGSGTVSLMALAKAFALGPKPKRSLLLMWHSGEEAGLYGSRYNADFPVIPMDKLAAQLNIDMIGRNRCDNPEEENTVYLVGADRISTELHNLNEDANASLKAPMKLDYEMNDPTDPESLYTRSDHYSYAAKGVPVIFYTTGLHKDYHYLTDEVSKIDFPKLAHITQLVYMTGTRVANLDHFPARDNKGPRKGKGAAGKIETK